MENQGGPAASRHHDDRLNAFLNSERKAVNAGGTPALSADIGLGGVKIIADEVTGSLHPSAEELNDAIAAIHEAGLQAAVHAIEEPVIEAAANAIESALKRIPRRDHRHRIEHCSVCRTGFVAAPRPARYRDRDAAFLYLLQRRPLSSDRAGDQIEFLYPIRSMMEHGLLLGPAPIFRLSTRIRSSASMRL